MRKLHFEKFSTWLRATTGPTRKSIDRLPFAAKHLHAFFERDGNECKSRDITSDMITQYAAHRLDKRAKPSTVNYDIRLLCRAFHLAVKAGKVGLRPEFEMLKVDNARKGFFEDEQYKAVLRHLPEYLKPVAEAAYITGWRTKSELLTRQWRRVDFTNGWLRLEPGETKNGKGRMFPLTPGLRAVFERQRERVREIEKAQG